MVIFRNKLSVIITWIPGQLATVNNAKCSIMLCIVSQWVSQTQVLFPSCCWVVNGERTWFADWQRQILAVCLLTHWAVIVEALNSSRQCSNQQLYRIHIPTVTFQLTANDAGPSYMWLGSEVRCQRKGQLRHTGNVLLVVIAAANARTRAESFDAMYNTERCNIAGGFRNWQHLWE